MGMGTWISISESALMLFMFNTQLTQALRKYRIQSDDQLHPLSLLSHTPQAVFNSYGCQPNTICLPGTRDGILNQIEAWADRTDNKCIFWLDGMTGTGKTTIARTIAHRYHGRGHLGASFFFSRHQRDLRHARKLFTSIAWQLAQTSAVLKELICEAVCTYRNIAHQTLRAQWTQLIFRPIYKLKATSPELPLIVVVDGLDECEDENDIWRVIQLFAEASSLGKGRLRILMTSKHESPVRLGFDNIHEDQHQDLVLHNIPSPAINQAVSIFFRHELNAFISFEKWPSELDIAYLVEQAGGSFIWAATACRFIKGGRSLARRRLSFILAGGSRIRGVEGNLEEVYTTILVHSIKGDDDEQETGKLLEMFREIVGSILILRDPLPAAVLARLLEKSEEVVAKTLNKLYSVLDVPNNGNTPVHLIHPSFQEFLLDKGRCVNQQLWVDERKTHHRMFLSCVELMSKALKQDLCNLGHPGTRTYEIDENRLSKCLPWELRYACRNWVEHLQRSTSGFFDIGVVLPFLQEHLLHWLEALALMKAASVGVQMLTMLQSLVPVSESERF